MIDKHMAAVMFLAWRCLYAELTRARIDKGTPDLQATGNMTITRQPTDCVRSVLEEMVETANLDE